MGGSSKHYQFVIPRRDSNLLKFLNQVDIVYRDDEAVLYHKNKQLYLHCDSDGVTISSIISTFQDGLLEAFEFDQRSESDEISSEIEIPMGLYYILSLSYMWSKIVRLCEKKMFLKLILRYVELLKQCLIDGTEKSQVNNLFNMLIFSITNIVLQEFDILEASMSEIKHNTRSRREARPRKRRSPKYDYEIEDCSSSESETTEFRGGHRWSDRFQIENKDLESSLGEERGLQTDQVVGDSTVLEISFLLMKFLVKLSVHFVDVHFSVVGLSEWSLILSLRVSNFVKKFSNGFEVEAFNRLCRVGVSRWESVSEALSVSVLRSIGKASVGDHQECDCLRESLFEVVSNCLTNGCIDLISNVSSVNSQSGRSNVVIKDFPALIPAITGQISQEFSSDLFVYILESLGTYWIRADKVEDIGEDNTVIAHVSSYVESISEGTPSVILKNLSLIRKVLNVTPSYKLRSCFISSVATSLIGIKSRSEGGSHYLSELSQSADFTLDNRPQIIESVDLILERVYDKHQNCRTKSIQSLQRLFANDIIPYSFFIPILKEIRTRTLDESSYVRSSSFNLIRAMMRKATESYYHLPLNHGHISGLLSNVNEELSRLTRRSIKELNESIVGSSADSLETEAEADCSRGVSGQGLAKKESEYELMKMLLVDAKEVSLIVEDILESVCVHGIHSKVNSDVSSCILFVCEAVSLNIAKGQSYMSSVLKCVWRVNNVNILNSLVHGFFIIVFSSACSSPVPESQEKDLLQNDLESDDHDPALRLQFSGRVAVSQSSVRNLLKMMEWLSDDDLMNLSKLLELLSSKATTQISKKYTSSFDLSALKDYTLSEVSSAGGDLTALAADAESSLRLSLELLFVVMKVESLNRGGVCETRQEGSSGFEVVYRIFLDSVSSKNYLILESSIKCLSLIEISDQACVGEMLSKFAEILSNVDFKQMNTFLLTRIVNSVFTLIANPSKIRFLATGEGGSGVLCIDLFVNRLFGYYLERLESFKEMTLMELSQVTSLLSHVAFKYGNFVENLYNKWKYLHSMTTKKGLSDDQKATRQPQGDKSNGFGLINLEEEYLEHVQMILESRLLSRDSVFRFIVPVINLLVRDPRLVVEGDESFKEEKSCSRRWQLDYSRSCALVSLCKLTSLTTKMLNVREKAVEEFPVLAGLSLRSKQPPSSLFEMPNIQLIFSLLYSPSSFGFIDKTQLDHIMLNTILCTNDLLTRYPNIIDPWMEKQYTLLNSDNSSSNNSSSGGSSDGDTVNHLKYNIMLVINYLLNIGFIKPRDVLLWSHLKCISKTELDSELSGLADSFFQEFFKDLNNQLAVNVIPLLVNQLALEYSLSYAEKAKTQAIIHQTQYLLHFVSGKDLICSGLIPKLFSRISLLNDPKAIELYVVAFEALKLGSKTKCIGKILENFSLIAFHVQEFDALRGFFAKILQNCVNSSQSEGVHSEIASLLKYETPETDGTSCHSSAL